MTVKTFDSPADFVLISGEPTNEPVVQHGPFVMNTRQVSYSSRYCRTLEPLEGCSLCFNNTFHRGSFFPYPMTSIEWSFASVTV